MVSYRLGLWLGYVTGHCAKLAISDRMMTMLNRNALKKVKLLAMEVDGVLTDGRTWQNSQGIWQRKFSVRDSLGLRALRKLGYEVVLLASFTDASIAAQYQALDISDFVQNCAAKMPTLDGYLRHYGFTWEECAYITHDVNDLNLVKKVAVSATVFNANSVLKSSVQLVGGFVSGQEGGDGAVREVCQLITGGGFYSDLPLQLKKAINT